MADISKIVLRMRASAGNVRFLDGLKVCTHYFGDSRTSGSHYIFKTPWRDDPLINIQNARGKMKPYQVKQVLSAIDRLKEEHNA